MAIKRELKNEIKHALSLIKHLTRQNGLDLTKECKEFVEFIKEDEYNWNVDTQDFLDLVKRVKESLKEVTHEHPGINADLRFLKGHINNIEEGMIKANPKQPKKIIK